VDIAPRFGRRAVEALK
ncbi:hypothetical protein A2U01_0115925, partial [Trifolium medium]|nr:hypothetical protein [Trifolium medium]